MKTMTDKLKRAEVILALNAHRERTAQDFEDVVVKYAEFFSKPCDKCGEVKLLADKIASDYRALETKLEDLL